MLIGGAAMTLVGLAVLLVEAGASSREAGRRGELPWARWMRRVSLPGAFLLGLSTFQAEFDFGVPQFQMIFHPMLTMLAASVSLVAARIWLGRGAAIGAVLFWLAMRGLMAVVVGPVLGEPMPHFPLYLVEAMLVELIALRVRKPLPLALASGAAIGTVGLAAEWGWTQVFMPYPWNAALLPEGLLLGLAMALAGACVGGWIGDRLSERRTGGLRPAAVLAAAAIFALTGYGLLSTGESGVRGTVALTPAGEGTVNAEVRVDPRDGADDAYWLAGIAWQGGGLVVDRLERTAPGVYRTTEPLPVTGEWKTMIRLHTGNALTALPIYLPADPAIPVEGVPAAAQIERPFGPEQQLLQRERKSDTAGWLWATAYGIVLAIALGFLILLAWGVHRVSAPPPPPSSDRFRSERERQPALRPART